MKKIFLIISFSIILLSLVSCKKRSVSFNKNDLESFLEYLDKENFTLTVNYQEQFLGKIINNVEYKVWMNENVMYKETCSKQVDSKDEKVITKVYSEKEKEKYYDYIYQTDTTGNSPSLTYIKEEITKAIYDKNKQYTKEFITNFNADFTFDDIQQCYVSKYASIYLDKYKVIVKVKNKENNTIVNMTAVYTDFGTCKVNKPKYVRKYKKDIINY